MISARSVKDRLKNQAREDGRAMQDELVTYGLERTIYRLSISKYAERFTLKGGIFLYALFDGNFARATMDIDLLAQHIPNDAEEMKKVFKDIFAYLDRTTVPVSIDIGFGDIIYPERMKMNFPVLLDMEAPEVYAYSIYSVIAEKFEAFVSLGLANGRYKDFYDIYVLSEKYDFDGAELQNAIVETFSHRGTGFNDIVAFEPEFTEDLVRQNRWNSFIKKKKAMIKVEFKDAVEQSKNLLSPIVTAIDNDEKFQLKWDKDEKEWI